MRFKNQNIIALCFLVSVCIGCAGKTYVVEGYNYDEQSNKTRYFVKPFGTVFIPGKWIKSGQSSDSYQQYFTNKDTVQISVTLGGIKNYEFNTNGSLTGYKFANAFYEWDSKHLATNGLERNVIERDSVNNFIIWRLNGPSNNSIIDTYFLIGVKNKNVYNLAVFQSDKWTTSYKIAFLRHIFFGKK